MARKSNYDKYPCVRVCASRSECSTGWLEVAARLKAFARGERCILSVECYPGAFEHRIRESLEESLRPTSTIFTQDLLKPSFEIDNLLRDVLGDDPVFGRMNDIVLDNFFAPPGT